MEKSQVRPTFLDKIINIWYKSLDKPTDSKRYVLFTQKHRLHDLTNILFSFAKGMCTIVENKVLKKNGSRTEKKLYYNRQKQPPEVFYEKRCS